MFPLFLRTRSRSEIDIDRVRHDITEMAVSDDDISSGDAEGELLPSWVGVQIPPRSILTIRKLHYLIQTCSRMLSDKSFAFSIRTCYLICLFNSFNSPADKHYDNENQPPGIMNEVKNDSIKVKVTNLFLYK
jgi:hypothetical protein